MSSYVIRPAKRLHVPCGSRHRFRARRLPNPARSAAAITAQRRALSVGSLWPGQAGYPFAYDLALSASSAVA